MRRFFVFAAAAVCAALVSVSGLDGQTAKRADAPAPKKVERGKYLVISSRQAGDWKIIADCWSSDLSLGVGVEPGVKPGLQNPGSPLARPPRKTV